MKSSKGSASRNSFIDLAAVLILVSFLYQRFMTVRDEGVELERKRAKENHNNIVVD